MFGVLWGCFLALWLGRRCPMAIGSLGSLCAWLVIARAPADSWNLYVARFMVGVSTGVVSLIVPAYIACEQSSLPAGLWNKASTTRPR
uniref:Uncharacterized protein n=1 Tax=Rhipicephalus microplus TaxID=6941 RepID=A0A6M2DD26_RHIMP